MSGPVEPSQVTLNLGQRLMLNYRRALVVAVHLGLWTLSLLGSFLLRFEFSIPDEYFPILYVWVVALLTIRSVCFASFGMFSGMWRYTGARDLVSLFKAATLSTLVFAAFLLLGGQRVFSRSTVVFPRSIFFIDWMVTTVLVGGLRFGIRTLWHLASQSATARNSSDRPRRILVVGAGNAGEMLVREMLKSHTTRYDPVAFVDDDARKMGQRIHGIPVVGAVAQVAEIARAREVEEVVVAVPSASGREMRRVLEACKTAGVPIRTIPGMDQVIDGSVTVSQLRNVAIEDLLGREPVTLDARSISDFLTGRVVMVTGAGGSIGSELCRQIARYRPAQLLLVERAENALFEIHRELIRRFPEVNIVACVADVCDRSRVESLFRTHRPFAVLHAAAHKHVPMMEMNPGEAVKNNVGGTRLLADMAALYDAKHFVLISTDKAVNPTSVMGATKRVAELYVQALSGRSKTRFVAVRFGNVLGSAGSVIPIFREQIAAGGPVTVTHPEMRRYFMTIPEASQLVLQAGAMGKGGEIFVLDMGEPVKIVDLARDLITLSGLRPDHDIEIQFSGVRPGEKLFEELNSVDEQADKTLHPKIFVGRLQAPRFEEVVEGIAGLTSAAESPSAETVISAMRRLVPEIQRSDAPPAADVIPLRRPADR